jgi:hypothetical protein
MNYRITAAVVLSVLGLSLGIVTSADTKTAAAKKAQAGQLVALLPASDGVVTLDAKRFFGDALPRLLSAKPEMLSDVVSKIEQVQSRTGIDLRQFEYIAAGVTARKTGPKNYDFDPVVLARGPINAPGLIGAAKLASNGKYREERVGTRTVYVISAQDIADQVKQMKPGVADKIAHKFTQDVAVTAYDANTIAFGSLTRVRETLVAKTHVGTDITGLLGRKEVSVANFAAKLPAGMSSMLPLENDELGKSIDSIRYLFGSLDVTAEAAVVNMTAKTSQNAQAQSLLETLQGLQVIGKAFLGGARTADKQVYARMIENAKFTNTGNEVSLDLRVSQSDIDILVGSLK